MQGVATGSISQEARSLHLPEAAGKSLIPILPHMRTPFSYTYRILPLNFSI